MRSWDKTRVDDAIVIRAVVEAWYSNLKPWQRTKAASDLVNTIRDIHGSGGASRNVVAEAKREERERIVALLDGIDKDEVEHPDGWWETSTGAAFGANILRQIKEGA